MRTVLTTTTSALFVLALAAPASAAPITIFTDTYDAAPTLAAGVTVAYPGQGSIQSGDNLPSAGIGFSGNILRNEQGLQSGIEQYHTRVVLNGLGAHTSVSVGFLLAIIDSWDGVGSGSGPDAFNVEIDGVNVFSEVFASASGGGQTRTANAVGGYAYNGSWADQLFDMTNVPAFLNVAHTGSTLEIDFFASGFNWQAGFDESWGIDNLTVSMDAVEEADPEPVPEPGTVMLLGLPVAGLAVRRLRRR